MILTVILLIISAVNTALIVRLGHKGHIEEHEQQPDESVKKRQEQFDNLMSYMTGGESGGKHIS